MRRSLLLSVLLCGALCAPALPRAGEAGRRTAPTNPRLRSPAAPVRSPAGRAPRAAAVFPQDLRSITGRGNNGEHREWGSAGVTLLRLVAADYADGFGEPAGPSRPGAREVSNACLLQDRSVHNRAHASGFLWQWGQFVDHDVDLTPFAEPAEAFDIPVPTGDPWFDPEGLGHRRIALDRSAYRMVDGVRQQVNAITAYLDGSQVYGSDRRRARVLRARDGSGRLATSAGDLPPFNRRGLPNAPSTDAAFFLAGDFRANEQVGLTALHTLFMREHNFWADSFHEADPELGDKQIYKLARAMVAAEIQAITYREFLPLLLGQGALAPYAGYDPTLNAGISNAFSTAAFRVGHTMLPARFLRLAADGSPIEAGHLPLRDAFFHPQELIDHGIEPLLRGLAAQPAQEVDALVIDDVRNFLFGPPGAGGFDLAALNIQRGRDHGLPALNQVRMAYGLPAYGGFSELTADPEVAALLAELYGDVADLDLWVGGLLERHLPGAMVGETFHAILRDQFERLRDGDRFWYESYLPADLVRLVERQTLARIIRRNTAIGHEIQRHVFRVPR